MSDSKPAANASAPALAFTGERYTPECVREMYYEHTARYAMAASLCRQFAALHGRKPRVLDAACGEGYGSQLLAPLARHVLGLDISSEAIAHASKRYGASNLRFAQADLAALEISEPFDCIVSFETLEHLQQQDAMLAGFRRMLAPGGVLLLSSPDRYTYSDLTGYQNPFHVKELYRDELEALLQRHFAHHRLFGQRLLFQSAIWDLQTDSAWHAHAETAGIRQAGDSEPAPAQADSLHAGLHYAPLYFIALAAAEAEAIAPYANQLHLFGDAQESIYMHYNDEIRKGIRAGELIQALQREIQQLRAQLA
jgi:SAM-dependent methyltransferase